MRQVKAILSEARRRLADIYGARLVRVILYGSQARGEAGEGSDIDVLVVLSGAVQPGAEISRTGEMAAEISLANNVVLSLAFVSQDRFRTERRIVPDERPAGRGGGMTPEQSGLLTKAGDSIRAAVISYFSAADILGRRGEEGERHRCRSARWPWKATARKGRQRRASGQTQAAGSPQLCGW